MDHKKDVKQTDSESSSLGTRNEKPASTDMASKEEGHYVETILPEGTNLNELGVPVIGGATGNKLLMWITFTASMGFGLFGYDQGVMSGLIGGPEFLKTFPLADRAIVGATTASLNQATIVSIYEVGCFAGAGLALIWGDKMGRAFAIRSGAILVVIGVLIQVTAIFPEGATAGYPNTTVQFIIGRVITGVGNGINTATLPTWLGECSRPKNRGFLICVECSMIAIGTAISYWINYGFFFIQSSVNWRVPIALQVIFAFILLIMMQMMPESPRWLISHGRVEEGQKVIACLEDSPFDSEVTLLKTKVILDSMDTRPQKKSDLLTSGPTQNLRRTLIGSSSQIFQQIGGCNAVIYYSTVIFEQNLLLEFQLALLLGAVLTTVYALASFGSFRIVETWGRRPMFLAGSLGQALSMFFIMGGLIPGTEAGAKASVVGFFFFLIFFAVTWLPLPWAYPVEISSLRCRTNANAVSTLCNWSFNFAVVQITPIMLTAIGFGTFAFFGVINFLFIPVIYLFYPETAGRSLEEIDVIFALAYHEQQSYVKVARTMPSLSDAEIESESRRLAALSPLKDFNQNV